MVYLKTELIVLFFLVCGCVPGIQVKDTVTQGSLKGYVKFYYLKNEGDMPVDASVWSCPAAQKIPRKFEEEGAFGMGKHYTSKPGFYSPFTNERALLVAKTPGEYYFKVSMGNHESRFKIRVQEGMVVPIKFTFKNVDVKRSYVGKGWIKKTITFEIDAVVEEQIPFSAGKPKK